MLIRGEWVASRDGVVRPFLRAQALTDAETWLAVPFLIDTGADRTVFSEPILSTLRLPMRPAGSSLAGVGGVVSTVLVETTIRLNGEDTPALVRGTFAATAQANALDVSVLGRDILDFFALVVDRPGDAIYLLGQRHRYTVVAG